MPDDAVTPAEPQGGQKEGSGLDDIIGNVVDGVIPGEAETPELGNTQQPGLNNQKTVTEDELDGIEDFLSEVIGDETSGQQEEVSGDKHQIDEGEEDPNNPKWLGPRLDRERKKIQRQFEDRISELESKLTKTQEAPKPKATRVQDFGSVDELESYAQNGRQVQRNLRQMARQHSRNPDQVEAQFKDTYGVDLSTMEDPQAYLEQYADNIQDEMEQAVPERRKFLEQRQAVTEATKNKFSWYGDPNSPLRQAVDSVFDNAPQLNQVAEAPFLVSAAVVGMRVMEAAQKRKASSGQRTPPKAPPAGSGNPPKKSSEQSAKDLKQRALSGDEAAVDEFFSGFAPV
tara:strand:+ start:3784 stop:4812 length:1029 start_codon:yes stop_codon:yes gene_type:complete